MLTTDKSGYRHIIRVGITVLLLNSTLLSRNLQVAQEALHDKLYGVAKSYAEPLAQGGHPQAEEALLIVLEVLAAEQDYAGLLQRLRAGQAVVLQAKKPEAFAFWEAIALLYTGSPTQAQHLAEKTRASDPEFATLLQRTAARAAAAAGNSTRALELYATINSSVTNKVVLAENALEWAQVLEQENRQSEALQVLKEQSELGVVSSSVSAGFLLRGQLLLRSGRVEEGVMVLTRLAMDEGAGETARCQALLELSQSANLRGEQEESLTYARAAYERAEERSNRLDTGYHLGIMLAASTNTLSEAEEVISTLVREFPESRFSMQAQLKLADELLRHGKAEKAATQYKIFLETCPIDTLDEHALQGRGWALMKLGKFAEAGVAFQRVARITTNMQSRVAALINNAEAQKADQRCGEAAETYFAVWQQFPQSEDAPGALYASAECLATNGSWEKAIERFKLLCEKFPNHKLRANAMLRTAGLQMSNGAVEGAIATYAFILKEFQQPDTQAEARLGRGKARYRLYRFESAMQDFVVVSESDVTRRDEARFMTVLCLYGLGRDQEARSAAAGFLLNFPESPRLPDMILWLGKFNFNQGEFVEARRNFMDYVTRWPEQTWTEAALLWAARSAIGAHDLTDAVQLVTRLLKNAPESPRVPEAKSVQAEALIELARFDEAILLLDQVISQVPESEWGLQALIRKGDSLFALGADNANCYERALEAYQLRLAKAEAAPGLLLQLHYKSARCLEKLNRIDDAVNHYYAEVIIRFQEERLRGVWYDDNITALFVRAVFNLSELYETRHDMEQAVNILDRVIRLGVPGTEEAKARMERLRNRKGGVS